MQRLAEENQRMKQQLAELEAMQRMTLEQAATARAAPGAQAIATTDPEAATPAPALPGWQRWMNWRHWKSWNLLLAASVLLLAFATGGWLVDWGVRRRHGGYRI